MFFFFTTLTKFPVKVNCFRLNPWKKKNRKTFTKNNTQQWMHNIMFDKRPFSGSFKTRATFFFFFYNSLKRVYDGNEHIYYVYVEKGFITSAFRFVFNSYRAEFFNICGKSNTNRVFFTFSNVTSNDTLVCMFYFSPRFYITGTAISKPYVCKCMNIFKYVFFFFLQTPFVYCTSITHAYYVQWFFLIFFLIQPIQYNFCAFHVIFLSH